MYPSRDPARKAAYMAIRYRERDEVITKFKDAPCADCGVSYPPYVMDFDHVRGNKIQHIGRMRLRKMSILLEEIAKCEVVCSNCHRIRTYNRRNI